MRSVLMKEGGGGRQWHGKGNKGQGRHTFAKERYQNVQRRRQIYVP